MKCVILAGGYGTRISEESHLRPKPVIEIGGRPILWHVMKLYAAHGIDEFIPLSGPQRLRHQGILRQRLIVKRCKIELLIRTVGQYRLRRGLRPQQND